MNGEHVVAIGERLHRVGTVRFGGLRQKQVSSFRYADDWIGNPAAFALAPSLPLSDQWFHFASPRRRRRHQHSGCLLGLRARRLGKVDYRARVGNSSARDGLRAGGR